MTRDEEEDEKEAKAGDEHIPEGEVIYAPYARTGTMRSASRQPAWPGPVLLVVSRWGSRWQPKGC
jgi:hypothetical protein